MCATELCWWACGEQLESRGVTFGQDLKEFLYEETYLYDIYEYDRMETRSRTAAKREVNETE